MMLFGKKKEEPGSEEPAEERPAQNEAANENMISEMAKLRASVESLMEVKKSTTELFYRLNEQIGELRAMIVNSDKNVQQLESKSAKAIGLVEALDPGTILVQLQKQDGKIEALRANIESNETMMTTITQELKEIRRKINEFKGMEQVVKLYNDTKDSLVSIQKTEANTSRHADRVETIFGELQKTYQEAQRIQADIEGVKKALNSATTTLDKIKLQVSESATKKEIEPVISKSTAFEKNATNILETLDRRAKSIPAQLNEQFKILEKEHRDFVQEQVIKAKKAMEIFEEIEKKAPQLAEHLKLAELHYKEDEPEPEEPAIPLEDAPKKGLLAGIMGKLKK